MDDGKTAFWVFVLGAVFGVGMYAIILDGAFERSCEKQNNVYDCEMTYQPIN